jgi:hypothetical protein
MPTMRTTTLLGALLASAALPAQVRVNPTGVNVNMMNPTTVFLTFGGVRANLRPAEAYWCGELVPAAPDVGVRCKPGTLFGQLPSRYDLSRASGTAAFTDIMSIPASVARRAWQDARRGETASFYYVRRFVNVAGGRDEFVAVTCRPSAGGARTPFALTDVRVRFDGRDEVQFVPSGQVLPPFAARISYNGTGRLVGRWEVVLPGEEGPSALDLLPEASLPVEERTTQRRFAQVERFNIFVPPGGTVTLPGPDPARLPTSVEGSYLVLLRIEATDDREGDSNLGGVGAGRGVVHSGAVAGFPMPVLRYVVAGDGTAGSARHARLSPLGPRDGAVVSTDSAVRLAWSADRQASWYRIEVEGAGGASIVRAIAPAAQRNYVLPGSLMAGASGTVRWRVWALDGDGRLLRRTPWRTLQASP